MKSIRFLSFVLVVLFGFATAQYQQAPSLSADLPPVAERLPNQPLVLEPVEEVGTYGGTWRMVDYDDTLGWTRQTIWIEPFVKFNRDLNGIRPNVLESWEWNDDATGLTLNFREGMKWSDGEPLTANDYLFWWNDMVINENVPVEAPTWTRPGGEDMIVEKVDDYTVRLGFSEPNPLFLEFAGRGHYNSAQQIVPAHYLKQFHPDYSDAENSDELMKRYDTNTRLQYPDMPTFLAWKVKQFNSGQSALFERNPYYWKVDTAGNQLPYIDNLEVQISSSGSANEQVTLKAIAGELDMQTRDIDLKDISLVLENAEAGDYRVLMWSRGDFAWPWLMLMYDYPDAGIVDLKIYRPGEKMLVASTAGDGFVVSSEEVLAQTKAGKQVMTLGDGVKMALCLRIAGDHVAVVGDNRKVLIFPLAELPEMGKGKGVRLQKYKDGGLSDATTFELAKGLTWKDPAGRTRTELVLDEWLAARATAGRMAPRGFPRDNRF